MLSKEKRIQFNKIIDQYSEHLKKTNDPDYIPEIKSISDRILLYLQYGIFRCKILYKISEKDIAKLKRISYYLYEIAKDKAEYTNKDPRLVAASIIYVGSVLQGLFITQLEISDVLYTNPASIRRYADRMVKLEKL